MGEATRVVKNRLVGEVEGHPVEPAILAGELGRIFGEADASGVQGVGDVFLGAFAPTTKVGEGLEGDLEGDFLELFREGEVNAESGTSRRSERVDVLVQPNGCHQSRGRI